MPADYFEIPPDPELAPAVECIWAVEASAAGSTLVLPDGCCDLVFRFHPESSSSQWVGAMTRPRLAPIRAGESLLGARFRPGMLGAVVELGGPLAPDAAGPLLAIAAWRRLGLEERLGNAGSTEERVAALQASLRVREIGGSAQAAIDRLVASGGSASLRELMDIAGLGERQLRRSFQSRAGLSPRLLARVVRFRRAARMARESKPGELADIASQCGYFDQAHMAKDFRELGGAAPRSFLAARG